MTSVKVLIPSVAIEVILHKQLWQRTSLRNLTLCLAGINAYWFATTLNWSFLETPFFLKSPHLSDQQKVGYRRQRFNWLNKIEIAVTVLGLDLYCEWRKRILDNNGYIDACLARSIWIPATVTAIQAVYLLPKLNKKSKEIPSSTQSNEKCASFPKAHCAYIGFEAVKLTGLAVAGLRFGKMLTL
ncbi:uncharacterized protein BX663DRAFT_482203 [Cokeromyces recurvatus]|uniref:uncharacterized protein n=1 Tax=Cokeromyces recurvatus TaxID=90255 RepID=UPI002220E679|nr:uncharacterized protein BX663DRAFT_482203 [Cokeromyces recurvatus]KAI7907959.1 hypothetical protein BX663DRAFT_482203 [Cokeromyces recurvatus]